MNYLEIDTAEDVLNAFKACQNAGEEIQLFESLAERENPPVDAFVEILRKIKLETVLALAIQAFGKITNDDVKGRLKGSEDLLVMLCEQAKSGATDLIKWSAATAIEQIGFDFIAVSQHMSEEPVIIIQRIVQFKVKILMDSDKNRHDIRESSNYDSFIRFWVYGATYELLVATMNQQGENARVVVDNVVDLQAAWGIKNNNFWLRGSFDPNFNENIIFTPASQRTSSKLLDNKINSFNISQIKTLLINQIYCLNSIDSKARELASNFLCQYNRVHDLSVGSCILKAIDGLRNSVLVIDKNTEKLGAAYKDQNKLNEQLEAINRQISSIDLEISSVSNQLTSIHHN